MLIVWFGPASAHISHFCEGFSIALAFYFRHQSTSKRWKFTVALSLLWHNTLTTFSHGLARGRLEWRYAYFMTSCVRIPPPLCATLRHPRLDWRHLLPLYSPSRTLLPLAPPHAPYSPLLPLTPLHAPYSPLLPLKKGARTVPILLLLVWSVISFYYIWIQISYPGLVVQSWFSVNPGLGYNVLF